MITPPRRTARRFYGSGTSVEYAPGSPSLGSRLSPVVLGTRSPRSTPVGAQLPRRPRPGRDAWGFAALSRLRHRRATTRTAGEPRRRPGLARSVPCHRPDPWAIRPLQPVAHHRQRGQLPLRRQVPATGRPWSARPILLVADPCPSTSRTGGGRDSLLSALAREAGDAHPGARPVAGERDDRATRSRWPRRGRSRELVFAVGRLQLRGRRPPDARTSGRPERLISAVAKVNPHTVVVLNTGDPVLMPWLSKVAARRRGVVSGPERRQRDRCGALGGGRSIGPPAGDLPRSTTEGAASLGGGVRGRARGRAGGVRPGAGARLPL